VFVIKITEPKYKIGTLINDPYYGVGMIVKYGLNDFIYYIKFPKFNREVLLNIDEDIRNYGTSIIKVKQY